MYKITIEIDENINKHSDEVKECLSKQLKEVVRYTLNTNYENISISEEDDSAVEDIFNNRLGQLPVTKVTGL